MTQERLAEKVNLPDVDGNSIAQLEGGRKKYLPEQPLLGAIARALGISEIQLLKESGVITEELPESGSPWVAFDATDVRGRIMRLLEENEYYSSTLDGIEWQLVHQTIKKLTGTP